MTLPRLFLPVVRWAFGYSVFVGLDLGKRTKECEAKKNGQPILPH